MDLIVTVVHVLVSLGLIFVVLLQKGSGADMGAAFGGSSQSVFGAQGSGSFLGKLTAGMAFLFMVTSLTLVFVANRQSANKSVMDSTPAAARQAAPIPTAPPATVPAAAPAAPADSAASTPASGEEASTTSPGEEPAAAAVPLSGASDLDALPMVPKTAQ